MDVTVECPTEGDTTALAARVASALRPGDVVVLSGPLGSGKTRFAAGLASGLGVDEQVVSPSFVLMREYRSGFLPLIHVDVYRLGSTGEFEDLDVFGRATDGVAVIEWGEAVAPALPPDYLEVRFALGDEERRILTFHAHGRWQERDLDMVEP